MSFDVWVEQRMSELRQSAQKYAEAKANVEYISEYKKTKLAILMKAAEVEGFKTATMQEREARAHESYIQLLDGLKAATEEAERLRWDLEMAKIGFEVWRTKQANERMERKGYGA